MLLGRDRLVRGMASARALCEKGKRNKPAGLGLRWPGSWAPAAGLVVAWATGLLLWSSSQAILDRILSPKKRKGLKPSKAKIILDMKQYFKSETQLNTKYLKYET